MSAFASTAAIDLQGTLRAAVFLGSRGGASTITQQLAKMQFHEPADNFFARTWQKFQEWVISAQARTALHQGGDHRPLPEPLRLDQPGRGYQQRRARVLQHDAGFAEDRTGRDARGHVEEPGAFQPDMRPAGYHAACAAWWCWTRCGRTGFISDQAYDSLKALPLGLHFQRVDHTEGPAPYFREVLRAQSAGPARPPRSEDRRAARRQVRTTKGDSVPYDIYTDGLKIYTTLDRRMQHYGEWAVREHLSTELQPRVRQGPRQEEEQAVRVERDQGGDRPASCTPP